MKMTTLYDLRDTDWNTAARKTIEEWFQEPKDLILTIYFRGDKLMAQNDYPVTPVYDLTYFLRQPDFVFTVDNFHDEITFGTFVDSVEQNMMNIMEVLYTPFFFAITTWPDSKYPTHCK